MGGDGRKKKKFHKRGKLGSSEGAVSPENKSIEIKVEDYDEGKPQSSGGFSLQVPSSPCSSSRSEGDMKERGESKGSLKNRKSAFLHNFLHPLDYYHERKSRSSTSSINSDLGNESGGEVSPRVRRSRTPEPQSKSMLKFFSRPVSPRFSRSSDPWPVYKPPLRQRVSCPGPRSGSPFPRPRSASNYTSPGISPGVSPNQSQHIEFYNNALQNPENRYPDGHQAETRYGIPPQKPKPTNHKSAKVSSSLPLPNIRISPPDSKGRRDSRRISSGSDSSDRSRSSSSSEGSNSSCGSSYNTDDSSGSSEGRRRRRYRHHGGGIGEAAKKSADVPAFKISLLGCEYSQASSLGQSSTPAVNNFLLSVVTNPPEANSARKSNSYNVPRGRHGRRRRKTAGDLGQNNNNDDDDDDDDDYGDDDEVFEETHLSPSSQSIHIGMESQKSRREARMARTSSVERLYSVYEQIIQEGQLVRRHSMEPERKRNGSGSSFGHTYLRGEDPNQAAIIFRDCRGLPAAAPFLENVKRSELEMDESQILVKFFKYHTTYDLIPTSAKLVIFDTRLQVKKAFYALVYNGVRAAPLWDAERQQFVGMLTITDFIRILQSFYNSPNRKMEELEEHRLEMWRTLLKDDSRKLISITPSECLYEAIKSLIHHKIHRLPVIDPTTGNVLYIITHKRILKFLFLYINELPKPSILLKSLRELNIGTYENIETAKGNTLIIEALNKFVERRISALPIVDDDGKLIDIYAKFDVINLAAEGTYHNLDVTLHQANEYRNEWFEGVLKCTLDETMEMIMERIVRAEVHRLVVVDKSNKVIGIISLSDILNELVLKPCHDDPASLKGKTIAQMEEALNGSQGGSGEELTTKSRESLLDVNPQLNQLQTGSDDSMAKSSWDSGDARKEDEGGGGPSSSADSIEDSKFRGIGVTNITENLGQHEVGPISG